MSSVVPEGWKETNLSSLVSVDIESLKGNTDPDYKFKYIDISCVSTSSVTPPSQYILFQNAPSRAKRVVRQNDVLIATVRPNLKAFAHFDEDGEDWVASTGFAVLRNKEWADSRFIFNVMLSDDVSGQIDKLVAGSNYPAINSSDVKDLTVLSPPLPEQKKIASILTSVDEVIENTQKQIDKLQDLKKATMNELLTKGIGHTEFKDSELGRIPKSWEVVTLNEITVNHDSKRVPIKSVDRQNIQGKYRYYGASGVIDYVEDYIFDGRYILLGEDGENVLSRNLPLAFIVEGKFWVNNHAHILQPTETVDIGFLCEYLESLDYKNIASGSAQPKITKSALSDIKVKLPSAGEQLKIIGVLSSIDKTIEPFRQKLSQTQSLKKSLMQDLLTGKVRVTVN